MQLYGGHVLILAVMIGIALITNFETIEVLFQLPGVQ